MHGGGYGSEFDDGNVSRKRKSSDTIGYEKHGNRNFHASRLPPKMQFVEDYEREQQRLDFAKFKSLNAYERHNKLVHDYLMYYGGKIEEFSSKNNTFKTDFDIIQENHQFIWDEEDNESGETWGKRLAKKYYDKLFKEYCISDLSRYKQNQFAMRWRTENEVHIGKGQFTCGAKKCDERKGLKSWEVNFAYVEHGEKKNTLIKLRLCPDCSYMLNYHKKHKQLKKKHKKEKKKRKGKKKKKPKKRKKENESSNSSDSDIYESANDDVKASSTSVENTTGESSIWKQPLDEPMEKSKDDLFDDYLEDLFM